MNGTAVVPLLLSLHIAVAARVTVMVLSAGELVADIRMTAIPLMLQGLTVLFVRPDGRKVLEDTETSMADFVKAPRTPGWIP